MHSGSTLSHRRFYMNHISMTCRFSHSRLSSSPVSHRSQFIYDLFTSLPGIMDASEPWELQCHSLFHAHGNLAIQGVICPHRALGDIIYQCSLHLAILDVLCPPWALGARGISGILGLQWAVRTTVWITCISIHFQVFLFPWEQLYIIVIYILAILGVLGPQWATGATTWTKCQQHVS